MKYTEQLLKKLNKIFKSFLYKDKIQVDPYGNFTNRDPYTNILITRKGFSIYKQENDFDAIELDLSEKDLEVILKAIKYLKGVR